MLFSCLVLYFFIPLQIHFFNDAKIQFFLLQHINCLFNLLHSKIIPKCQKDLQQEKKIIHNGTMNW